MRVIGADVWNGKWVAVVLDGGRFSSAFVAPSISAVIAVVPDATIVGVDMPIGLPGGPEHRRADLLARGYVGPRWASVFLTPPRELLTAPTHGDAITIAKQRGWPGISAQTYALRNMILDVELVARHDDRLHEVHPEVSFALANGGSPLEWPKSSWNGASLRRQILARLELALPEIIDQGGAAGVADVLDAAIVAWSANRIATGDDVLRLPAGDERHGTIWA